MTSVFGAGGGFVCCISAIGPGRSTTWPWRLKLGGGGWPHYRPLQIRSGRNILVADIDRRPAAKASSHAARLKRRAAYACSAAWLVSWARMTLGGWLAWRSIAARLHRLAWPRRRARCRRRRCWRLPAGLLSALGYFTILGISGVSGFLRSHVMFLADVAGVSQRREAPHLDLSTLWLLAFLYSGNMGICLLSMCASGACAWALSSPV